MAELQGFNIIKNKFLNLQVSYFCRDTKLFKGIQDSHNSLGELFSQDCLKLLFPKFIAVRIMRNLLSCDIVSFRKCFKIKGLSVSPHPTACGHLKSNYSIFKLF